LLARSPTELARLDLAAQAVSATLQMSSKSLLMVFSACCVTSPGTKVEDFISVSTALSPSFICWMEVLWGGVVKCTAVICSCRAAASDARLAATVAAFSSSFMAALHAS